MPKAKQAQPLPRLLPIRNAAELLSISTDRLKDLIAGGDIKAVKIGRPTAGRNGTPGRRVSAAEIERFIDAGGVR